MEKSSHRELQKEIKNFKNFDIWVKFRIWKFSVTTKHGSLSFRHFLLFALFFWIRLSLSRNFVHHCSLKLYCSLKVLHFEAQIFHFSVQLSHLDEGCLWNEVLWRTTHLISYEINCSFQCFSVLKTKNLTIKSVLNKNKSCLILIFQYADIQFLINNWEGNKQKLNNIIFIIFSRSEKSSVWTLNILGTKNIFILHTVWQVVTPHYTVVK